MNCEPWSCANSDCRAATWLVRCSTEQPHLWRIAAGVDAAPICPHWLIGETITPSVERSVLEVDELWSYVDSKGNEICLPAPFSQHQHHSSACP